MSVQQSLILGHFPALIKAGCPFPPIWVGVVPGVYLYTGGHRSDSYYIHTSDVFQRNLSLPVTMNMLIHF